MAKIVNIKTGLVREGQEKPKPSFCELCGTDINEMEGGVKGKIGQLPVAFCGVCVSGIIQIIMEHSK